MISTVEELVSELKRLDQEALVFFFDGETFQLELQTVTHRTYEGYHVWIQKQFNPEEARALVIRQIEESKQELTDIQNRILKDRKRLKEVIEYKTTLEGILQKRQ